MAFHVGDLVFWEILERVANRRDVRTGAWGDFSPMFSTETKNFPESRPTLYMCQQHYASWLAVDKAIGIIIRLIFGPPCISISLFKILSDILVRDCHITLFWRDFQVPKYEIQNGAYSALRIPQMFGRGLAAPPKEPLFARASSVSHSA